MSGDWYRNALWGDCGWEPPRQSSSAATTLQGCPYCGAIHSNFLSCPRIVAVEYYENGTVKRIELGRETGVKIKDAGPGS